MSDEKQTPDAVNQANVPDPQSEAKNKVWKVAPGKDAEYWDLCRERGYISIGWLPEADYMSFKDKRAIRQALIAAGNKVGGALSIWKFAREIKKGDIIVANKGRSTVVGIGRVTSDYLPSHKARDLVRDTAHAHARNVNWLIKDSVKFPTNIFNPPTVMALDRQRWQQIKQAYLEQNPELEKVFAELEGNSNPTPQPPAMPRELAQLMDMTARTRNVLLYGPPGTGKTWLVNHFTNYFLLSHNVSREKADEYWRAVADDDRQRVRGLSEQARGEAANDKQQFWWMNANEEEWDWKLLFERGEWCYGKRHPPQNFAAAKRGDLIFGYFARPHSQIVCTAYVTGELAWREFNGEQRECIVIKPGAWFARPLDWGKVSENELLKNSGVIRTNARGSMHTLSNEEAQELLRLINAEGNGVRLPPRGGHAEFVTFHQSFAYEEFVEGLKPVLTEHDNDEHITTERIVSESPASIHKGAKEIGYKIQPGVFRRICERAAAAWRIYGNDAPKYLLVIDEINRANIAKVLGELITLIEDDKRLGAANELTVRLPYSGARFGVPPNLYLLGTLNTADRSIALLDLALRRRFTFVEMMPRADAITPAVVAGVDLRALLTILNARVRALRDRDHQIGHSYLIGLKDADALHFAWYRRIVPLLQEYFYNDGERLRAVLGDSFTKPVEFELPKGTAWSELYEADRPRYEIDELTDEKFLDALRRLAGAKGDGKATLAETETAT